VNRRLDGPQRWSGCSGEDISCPLWLSRSEVLYTELVKALLSLNLSFASEISVASLEKYGGNMHVIQVNG